QVGPPGGAELGGDGRQRVAVGRRARDGVHGQPAGLQHVGLASPAGVDGAVGGGAVGGGLVGVLAGEGRGRAVERGQAGGQRHARRGGGAQGFVQQGQRRAAAGDLLGDQVGDRGQLGTFGGGLQDGEDAFVDGPV